MSDAPRCCKRVRDSGRWPSFHQCKCSASVEREGLHYCKIHDPVRVAEKDTLRQAGWETERQANQARWKRNSLMLKACEGLANGHLEMLAKLPRQKIIDLL